MIVAPNQFENAAPSASGAAQRARRAAKRARDQVFHPELNLPDYKPRRKVEVKVNSEFEEALEQEKCEYYAKTQVIKDEREKLDAQFREMNRIYYEKRRKLDAKDEDLYKQYMGL